MFGIKTYFKNFIHYPKFLFPNKPEKFSQTGIQGIKIAARLHAAVNRLEETKKGIGLGNLFYYPHPITIDVWKKFIQYSPNNSGNWSVSEVDPNQETSAIERELITKMIDLYKGSTKGLEGYVTSGGTEANLFSAWVGRKLLEKRGKKPANICVLKTSLTHYSIEKAADLVGVKYFIVGINKESWGMDIGQLEKRINALYKKGFRGFMIPLTLGYTITGTSDPFENICLKLRELKKRLSGVDFFVWIDAALNGLIEPFINKKFRPFLYPEIQTFLVDFHKFGAAPIPAGIILYRRRLRQLIERPISYLNYKDSTVLGSRPGIAPVACWALIQYLGKQGFKRAINTCLSRKKFFTENLRAFADEQIITRPSSMTAGVVFKSFKNNRLPKSLEEKYGLYPARINMEFAGERRKTITIYKLYFMSHSTKRTISRLLKDLKAANSKEIW